MANLKILMVSSEAGPYARTGGLGDVMAALPAALAKLGHEVRVFLPLYGSVDHSLSSVRPTGVKVGALFGDRMESGVIMRDFNRRDGVDHYFVASQEHFGRADLYCDPRTGHDFSDNDLRFAFFSRAVLEATKRQNWKPDIVHIHDWQAALVVVYLKTAYAADSFFDGTRTVLTIHNLGYQGLFKSNCSDRLGLPEEMFYAVTGPLEFFGKINFLKGGIALADKITTVSERYAREIQTTEEFGCGLEGILKSRSSDLHGIVNGVDYAVWSPSRDKYIPRQYSPSNLSGKKTTRVELLGEAGLPVREKVPLIGVISRLTDQKGIDLVTEAAEELFRLNLQMIVLGTGDDCYHQVLRRLESRYPDKLKVYLEFNDRLAHMIQAGADMFLMPSRYEPCGLNQLYSLKYGTVPVVREVGGLADTVSDYDERTGEGSGFVFGDYTPEALLEAVGRAVRLFGRRRAWTKLMKAGMALDYSWGRSAGKYTELYESTCESVRATLK